jgi:hypothetical protein
MLDAILYALPMLEVIGVETIFCCAWMATTNKIAAIFVRALCIGCWVYFCQM